MKKALIVAGGWDGHEPEKMGALFQTMLEEESFAVTLSNTLNTFEDADYLRQFHLIVPIWTMGEIEAQWASNISEVVADGTGIAGCHGGMCDAFRNDVTWQFITGGNWVSHPGDDKVEYTIDIRNNSSLLTQGISSFKITSEQYYLHVDPAVEVLASTRFPLANGFHASNGVVDVPQVWTKRWGIGRVYYNALGHNPAVFEVPEAKELMKRGLLWAAEGKQIALEQGINGDAYRTK